MELGEDQRAELRRASKQVRNAAFLLRSVCPDSFRAAKEALTVCTEVWGCQAAKPSVQGFAGLLRYAPMLGPNTQDTLRLSLEGLIERMGLTQEVVREIEAPREIANNIRR